MSNIGAVQYKGHILDFQRLEGKVRESGDEVPSGVKEWSI